MTDEALQDYFFAAIASTNTYALAKESQKINQNAHVGVKQAKAFMDTRDVEPEMSENGITVHEKKDIVNQDVHVLAIKKLVTPETIGHKIFPEDMYVIITSKRIKCFDKIGLLCVKHPQHQGPITNVRAW